LYLRSAQATIRFTDGTNTLSSSVEQVVTFQGTQGANITVDDFTRTVSVDSQLVRESAPQLGQSLNALQNDIYNLRYLNNISVDTIAESFSFNFGDITSNRTSIIDWIINSTDIDFGTILSSSPEIVDLGVL